jgi:hypothetical protein
MVGKIYSLMETMSNGVRWRMGVPARPAVVASTQHVELRST